MSGLAEALDAHFAPQAAEMQRRRDALAADRDLEQVPDPWLPGQTCERWAAETDPRLRGFKTIERAQAARQTSTGDQT